MLHSELRWSCLIALGAVLVVAGAVLAGEGVTRRDAEQLRQKVATITQFAQRPTRQTQRTTVTENEVNAYLAYDAHDELPVGVVDPTITILGTGRLSGRAVVDLDAVRKQRNSTSLLDPMNYLTGRLPLTATGVLKTGDGVGRFELESATVGGVPIPKTVLQQIVSHYSHTPTNPDGIGLDDPFTLPARIREIQVDRGQAIVIQ